MTMTYKALYRVYRPQCFGDVVGQEAVTRTLRNAIKERRISHAYLFNGPRGTGKTSAAKIFAKAVNCLNPQDGEPCNECTACVGVQSGEILDIIEIDAASNRGVDEIRDIRDKVHLSPNSLTYKVYIIDEVHMLTTEAFNALLKTLEEPPGHVIFILATTEPHKLPLTIISRCQRFDFHKISPSSLFRLLRNVCDQQGIRISDETLSLIARYSEGGGRDALSVLDQAYSFSGDEITSDDIYLITGTLSSDFLRRMLIAIMENERAEVMSVLDGVLSAGKDPEQVLRNIIHYLRDLLIYQNAPQLEEMQARVALEPEFIQLSESVKSDQLFGAIEHLSKVQADMKYSAHPRIMLEVALIQLLERVFIADTFAQAAVVPQAKSVDQGMVEHIRTLEKRIADLEKGISAASAAENSSRAPVQQEERKRVPTSSDLPLTRLKSIYQQANDKYLERILQLWSSILDGVRLLDVRAAAWLKQGKPVIVSEQQVLLAFNSAIHRESTELPANKKVIEDTLYDRTNIRFEIVTVMLEQWTDFVEKHKDMKSVNQQEPELEPIIAEAIQLVGEELIQIKK